MIHKNELFQISSRVVIQPSRAIKIYIIFRKADWRGISWLFHQIFDIPRIRAIRLSLISCEILGWISQACLSYQTKFWISFALRWIFLKRVVQIHFIIGHTWRSWLSFLNLLVVSYIFVLTALNRSCSLIDIQSCNMRLFKLVLRSHNRLWGPINGPFVIYKQQIIVFGSLALAQLVWFTHRFFIHKG